MFGFGAGSAKITTALKLVDKKTGQKIFAGNFTGNVGSWMESGSRMYQIVANDFSQALKKELKRLEILEKKKE